MKIYLTLLCALCTFYSVTAQSTVDSMQLMQDVKTLSSDKMEGRKTGTKGNRMAQFYIKKRFQQIGLEKRFQTYELSFFFNVHGKKIMGTNLMGYIKGTTHSWIVISAHYDHLGISKHPVNGDSIYNGADDNASGIAGLLALASYFKKHPPRHNLFFVAFDAEEEGLKGSQTFINQSKDFLQKIKLNINMDMISHSTRNELYACGTHQFPKLKPYLQSAGKDSKIKLMFGHDRKEGGSQDWVNQSDQSSFYAAGIPFIYFGVEDHPDYHKVTDEFSTITPSFFYHATETILQAIKKIDQNLEAQLKVPPRSKWIMKD